MRNAVWNAIQRRVVLVILSGCLIGTAAAGAAAQDETLADFESGTYQGWTLHGNCFGKEPAAAALFSGQIDGYGGSRFLCTLDPKLGTAATGLAVSAEFTIDRPVLRFRIGGGNYPRVACLNLVVEGKVVRTETGNEFPELDPASWDVSALEGKKAHLEVLDATTNPHRGYIMVDDIVLGYPSRPESLGGGSSQPEDDAGGDGGVNPAQEAIIGSAPLLKACAALNAARLRAHLPLLALDPALMSAAKEVAAAKDAHVAAPSLSSGWQVGGFGDVADAALRDSPFVLDGGCKTVGLAEFFGKAAESGSRESGSRESGSSHGWAAVYGRERPGLGSVIALAFPSAANRPVPQNAPAPQNPLSPLSVSDYRLKPLRKEESELPPLPGWGAPILPDHKPDAVPAASPSGLSVFPVLDGADWSDSFGAPRVGHTHQGEDLMAPKMRPLVACFSGTVTLKLAKSTASTAGNTIHVTADNGWTAIYMHVNCDTPGTLDGKGGVRYAFAPGLKTGDRVRAGQCLGYTGDSGNARGGASHCHFELHPPGSAAINPTAALRAARILRSPEAPLIAQESPPAASSSTGAPPTESERLPGEGEIQVEGTLSALSQDGLLLNADIVTLAGGNPALLPTARLKAACWPSSLPVSLGIKPGSRIIVVGHDSGPGTLLTATLLVFRL